jgi:putative ABC transport system ATP-binding protein
MTIISTEQVNKSVYTGQTHLQILSDISISVKAGETMAILGASGSGKSTLLSLLAGLDTPTSGKIKLLGQEISSLDEEQRTKVRAGQVGFVFQSFHLLPQLTTLENVMLPLIFNYNKVAKQKALSILENLGLGDRLMHLPKQLSGGEQQRVAIARAYVTRPKIIFADEPTGNLDEQTGNMIIKLLFDLNLEDNTTLVLVTHDKEIASKTHSVIQLKSGKII